jgi:hypothetical protein
MTQRRVSQPQQRQHARLTVRDLAGRKGLLAAQSPDGTARAGRQLSLFLHTLHLACAQPAAFGHATHTKPLPFRFGCWLVLAGRSSMNT